jgi:hypothetical protein
LTNKRAKLRSKAKAAKEQNERFEKETEWLIRQIKKNQLK